MRTRSRTVIAAVAAGAALVGLVAGCAGEQPKGSEASSATSTGPGSDHGSDEGSDHGMDMAAIPEPPEGADWNVEDATYLTDMIGHHRQALDMAELAQSRAADPRVRAIAATIDAGQAGEIVVMATWLVDHDLPEPTLEEVEHMSDTGAMPGMLDAAQLATLADAEGPAFDRLFLQDMIQHHQGALGMAGDVAAAGEDTRVVQMATDVLAGQSAEIRRMREILATLP